MTRLWINIIFILLMGFTAKAQETGQTLNFQILSAQVDQDVDAVFINKLNTKIKEIFTTNHIVDSEGAALIIRPSFNFIEFGVLEGITKEQTAKVELVLELENIFTQELITVFSKTLASTGKTKRSAYQKTIQAIKPSKQVYQKFINEALDKIDLYYQSNCDKIIAEVEKAKTLNQLEKAVALISSLPESTNCRKDNQVLDDEIYTAYQAQNCERLLSDTRIALLKKNNKEAINLISKVDVASPCGADAKILLAEINKTISDQTEQKLAFLNKVYNDNKAIQLARQASQKSISNTYIEGISK